jgi:hypothetical protein
MIATPMDDQVVGRRHFGTWTPPRSLERSYSLDFIIGKEFRNSKQE